MYSNGPPLMAEQKQDDHLEHTYSSYVKIRDVVQKTCQRRWTIGKSGKRGPGISVRAARHDDDCYTSWWNDWLIFMISGSNEQLQQQLEYTLLKSDCHSWWISKMQSGRQDTLEFCSKLGKNATETFGMLQTAFRPSCMNRASVFNGIRDSRKAGSLWVIIRGVKE